MLGEGLGGGSALTKSSEPSPDHSKRTTKTKKPFMLKTFPPSLHSPTQSTKSEAWYCMYSSITVIMQWYRV